jgi:hypothetical protein
VFLAFTDVTCFPGHDHCINLVRRNSRFLGLDEWQSQTYIDTERISSFINWAGEEFCKYHNTGLCAQLWYLLHFEAPQIKTDHTSLATLVFLDKSDNFYPSDLGIHVTNTHPTVNFVTVDAAPLGLANLDILNDIATQEAYLTSTETLAEIPRYLHGQAPNKKTLQTEKAVGSVIIVVEKGNGTVDAFYMYFYSFNQGPTVYGHDIGNHLGDW